jgi:hypothetical protein
MKIYDGAVVIVIVGYKLHGVTRLNVRIKQSVYEKKKVFDVLY